MMTLALHGGAPVRSTRLPYARQAVDEDDVRAVVEALRSPMLTTGPTVAAFEAAVAARVGAREGVAVSSGTAALHAMLAAAGVDVGDEVIVPPMTFVATANAAVFLGAVPVFADVDPHTLLLDPRAAERRITPRTRAIVGVDYAGQPCDYRALRAIANRHGVALLADACHALGATDAGRPVGSLADATAFSFHPVKHITTGEGGMVTTNAANLADRMRRFRNHGITVDYERRQTLGSWDYDVESLGHNYRLTDLQCALGISQLRKLDGWLTRRREIARRYDDALADLPGIRPLARRDGADHAYHLYVVHVDAAAFGANRATVFAALTAEGIGVNVHYIPVHLHALYRRQFSTRAGDCPAAETAAERILSLPMYPHLSDADVDDVIAALTKVSRACAPATADLASKLS